MLVLKTCSELTIGQPSISHDSQTERSNNRTLGKICDHDNKRIRVKLETKDSNSEDDDSYDELTMYEHFTDSMPSPARNLPDDNTSTLHIYTETTSATPADKLIFPARTFDGNDRSAVRSSDETIAATPSVKLTSPARNSEVVNTPVIDSSKRNETNQKKEFRRGQCLKLKANFQVKSTNDEILRDEATKSLDLDNIVNNSIDLPNKVQDENLFDETAATCEQRHGQSEGNVQGSSTPVRQLKHKRLESDSSVTHSRFKTKIFESPLGSSKSEGSKVVFSTLQRQTTVDQTNASEGSDTNLCGKNTKFELSSYKTTTCTYTNSKKTKSKHSALHQCSQCSRTFPKMYALKEHKTIHTGEKPHICEVCGKSFRQKRTLKIHVQSQHSTEANFTCNVCFKGYKTRDGLRRHMTIHAGSDWKCDTCGKNFSCFRSLKNHVVYRHSEIFGGPPRNLECMVCQKIFSNPYNLKLHVQIHEGNQRFGCDLCGSFFSRKIDRDRHLMRHTGEKPYKCDQCDYCCVQPGTLNVHKLKHAGENSERKRHSCPYCNKTLARKSEMKAHILTHSSKMNCNIFKCQTCGESFESRFSLGKHNIESHKKEILCEECGKAFTSVTNKNRHIKRHHSFMIVPCNFCSKSFRCKANLRDHMRFVHKENK